MPSAADQRPSAKGDGEQGENKRKNRPGSLSSQNSGVPRIKTGTKTSSNSALGDGGSRRMSAASVTSRVLSSRKQTEKDFEVQTRRVTFMSTDLQSHGLKTHDLSFHGLTQVPSDTFRLKDIGELDLSENNLRSIPPEIKNLHQLRVINLMRTSIRATSGNDFSGLPKELGKLPFLQALTISECNLRHVPPALFLCLSLRQLDVSRNKLLRLPPDIGNLVNLENLRASETGLTGLPPEIAYCERLQDIDLYGNALETLPETLRELHDLRRLKLNARTFQSRLDEYVTKMIRSGQVKSEHIPRVLFEIPELESLDLDGTKINSLPERCACRLFDLRLSNNFFLAMPKGLRSLTCVETLDMSHNFMTSLPDDIGAHLPSVRVLALARNQIDRLPVGISELTNLVEMDLTGNRLSQLPSTIGALSSLRILRLRDNRLSSLPDTICDLVELHTLDLTNNHLTELPVRMHELRKITTMHGFSHMREIGLWLHKNPIVEPPEHIWKTVHVRFLFNYLRKLQIRRTENLQPLKVIVLGAAGCGKTTLLQRLVTGRASACSEDLQSRRYLSKTEVTEMSKPLPHDDLLKIMEDSNSTSLADIGHWQTENEIRVCSFDLGGSDIYKAFHSQLLDSKALYLLAFDARSYSKEHFSARLGCWLDMLNLYAPGAVLKVVSTRAADDDNVTEEADRATGPVAEVEDNREPEGRGRADSRRRPQLAAMLGEAEEHILEHLREHRAKLDKELQQVEKLIEERLSEKKEEATGDILDFDPMANLMQLERRKQQIKDLVDNPLRKIDAIIDCHDCENLVEVQELAAEIERLAINKKLFPHAQSFLPTVWKKLRGAIKKRSGFFVTWEHVNELSAKYKLYDEYLLDCLTFLHETGDILWLSDRPALRKYIFHKPRKLVDILKGIVNHSMSTILDFEANKAFSSFGKLTKEQFEEARCGLQQYGEVSRQVLLSLWFYLQPTSSELSSMCEIASTFELGYLIPQPEAPSATAFKEPFMVIPLYVTADDVGDLHESLWTPKLPAGHREIQLAYAFPILPCGSAFERLCTRLQEDAQERLDWRNAVYVGYANGDKLLARRSADGGGTGDVHVDFKVRSSSLRSAYQTMARTHQAWAEILHSIPGLVWMVTRFAAAKKE